MLKDFLDKLEQMEEVKIVFLFGSRVKGKAGKKSDYDIAIVLDKPNDEAESRIFSLAGNDMDVSFFHRLPLFVRASVLREGKVLICKDKKLLDKIMWKTMTEYLENKELYAEVY